MSLVQYHILSNSMLFHLLYSSITICMPTHEQEPITCRNWSTLLPGTNLFKKEKPSSRCSKCECDRYYCHCCDDLEFCNCINWLKHYQVQIHTHNSGLSLPVAVHNAPGLIQKLHSQPYTECPWMNLKLMLYVGISQWIDGANGIDMIND